MTTNQYFKEHGLDPDFVKNTLGWDWTEEVITIPIYDMEGKLLFCKYRNLVGDKKFTYDSGSHPTLYGIHRVKNQHTIVVCEGEPDCAKLWQENIPAVTCGGVTSLNPETAAPLQGKKVIILLDTDKAGQEAIPKYAELLVNMEIDFSITQLPEGVKDVCEYFVKIGSKTEMSDLIDEAVSLKAWREQHKPNEFNVLSGIDVRQKNIPDQQWLINRMIPIEGFTFLIGSEGVGKSFYALTIGNAIATNQKWLKTFGIEKQTNVLFLDKENTLGGIQRRMKGLGITGEGLFFLEYPEYFDFTDNQKDDGISDFAKYIQQFVEANNIGLVIIDSFIDFMVGDENSSGETKEFFSFVKKILLGKSIVFIHHAGKSSQAVTRTSAQKTRGSTNIMAQAFSAFFIEQLPKQEHQFSVEQTKLRDAQKIKKFKVEMEIHQDPYDKDNSWVTGLNYGGEIENVEEKNLYAEEIIMEILNANQTVERAELKDQCIAKNISPAMFDRVIKALKNKKVIEMKPSPKSKLKKTIGLI